MKLEERLKLLRSDGIVPRAVIYARFSSDNQREESIDAQLRAAREFAQAYEIKIVREYVDKAKSATSADRECFQQMIRDSAGGTFHFVLVHKYDRFARNRSDSIGYRLELKKNGVTLVSVLESFDNESPEGALLEGVLESMNEFYSRNLAREVMKGLKENAYKGLYNGGTLPYGYDLDPTTQKYIVNPVEAEAIKLIFRMVQHHYSYNDVITELTDKGYRTKTGGFFRRNSLHDILRNPRYTGLYTYMRRTPKSTVSNARNSHRYNPEEMVIKIPDGIPAIIDQEVFNEVQLILDSRKGRRYNAIETPSLLTSKVVCGVCGMPYCADRIKRKNGINYYVSYRCNSRKRKGSVSCSNGRISQEYLDGKVISLLSDILFNPAIIPRLLERYNKALSKHSQETSSETASLKNQLKSKNKAISNILKCLERTCSDELTQHLLDLENDKKALMEKLQELESNNAIAPMDVARLKALLQKAKILFQSRDVQDNKRLIDTFIDKVVIYEDSVEVIVNPIPFTANAAYAKISEELPRK